MFEIAKKPFEITEQSMRTHAFSGRLLKDYPLWLEALLTVKRAAARANFGASLLSESEEQAIQNACEQLMLPEYRDLFQVDVFQGGGGIGVHTNINEAIHAYTQESGFPLDIKTKINMSQSTSDVLSSASSIALLKLVHRFIEVLLEVENTCFEKSRQCENVLTMARTCLRDALPAPLGKLFEGYALVARRQRETLEKHITYLEEINLGGTVIGSGEGAPLTYQALVIPFLGELTELPLKKRENLFDAAQNSDRFGSLSASLSQAATSWIKISKDLRLMSSGPLTGLNEISLPAAIPGSSFFSGKINPTLPETMIQAAFLVLGNHRAVQATQEHGELYLNVFETCGALKIYESLEVLSTALSNLNEHCLKDLTINKESCERWVSIWEKNHHA